MTTFDAEIHFFPLLNMATDQWAVSISHMFGHEYAWWWCSILPADERSGCQQLLYLVCHTGECEMRRSRATTWYAKRLFEGDLVSDSTCLVKHWAHKRLSSSLDVLSICSDEDHTSISKTSSITLQWRIPNAENSSHSQDAIRPCRAPHAQHCGS